MGAINYGKSPAIVYKYFDWGDSNARKILTKREMYFGSARQWEADDEYQFSFNVITDSEVEKIKQWMEVVVSKRAYEDNGLYKKWISAELEIDDLLKKELERQYDILDVNNLDSFEQEFAKDSIEGWLRGEIIFKRLNELKTNSNNCRDRFKGFLFYRTGIFSTSLVNDSSELWRDNGNAAVCVGLDFNVLKRRMDSVGNYLIGTVSYNRASSKIDILSPTVGIGIDDIISIVFSLRKDCLDKEKELRIMRFLLNNCDKNSPERCVQLPDDAITSIIINSKVSLVVEKEIKEMAKKISCTNVSIY
jgi:hypothetical protein